jgi:glutamine synthetase
MNDVTIEGRSLRDTSVKIQRATLAEAKAFSDKLSAEGVEFVRFEMADMAGLARGKTIPIKHVASYMQHGLNLYGGTVALDSYSIPVRGSGYNEEMNFTDCLMVVDQSSLSPVPWLQNTVRVVCDTIWYDGRAQLANPRIVLKRILSIAEQMGFKVMMGHEYEFYLVDPQTRRPIYDGQPIFVIARTHQFPQVDALLRTLDASGIDMITYNAEHGPGQMELNFSALVGVAAADRAFVFKSTVKEYMRTQGMLATFMTKPYKGLSGSCSHFHVSLLDANTGRNMFFDAADPDGMSAICKQFSQGVLDHARAAMAMWNPTTNCYRRIRPRTYAPSNISWGVEDRSASVRINDRRRAAGCAQPKPVDGQRARTQRGESELPETAPVPGRIHLGSAGRSGNVRHAGGRGGEGFYDHEAAGDGTLQRRDPGARDE